MLNAFFVGRKEGRIISEELKLSQQCFADKYIECRNATEAYLFAFPRVKNRNTAKARGSKLLTNVNIKSYIEQKYKDLSESTTIADAAEVLEYLTAVMRGGETEDVVVVEGVGEGKSKARNVQKGLSAKERLKAAELLGKRYGIFTEKAQIDAEIIHIIDDIPKVDENG